MSDEELLPLLRQMERALSVCLGWFPYSDELPEEQRETWAIDYATLSGAVETIRPAVREAEARILDRVEANNK